MNYLDVILILLILSAVIFAFRQIRKGKCSGCCDSCNQDCTGKENGNHKKNA